MRTSLKFGKVAGIPLKVHLNWFLTAVLVTWSLAGGYFPQQYPGWEGSTYWLAGIFTALLFFVSVLFHELGHALIALQEGVPVNSITLFIFGGVAHIASEPPTAKAELRIVIAGPLTSFALASLFALAGAILWASPLFRGPAVYLSGVNFLLGAFNLLPGFPLDGGRVLRALFWAWKGDFRRATRWATHAGLAVALLFVLGGLALIFSGHLFNGLWIIFIGWYLGSAARDGYRQAEEFDPNVQPALLRGESVPGLVREQGLPLPTGKRFAAGLFTSPAGADRALRSLHEAGFSGGEISVLALEKILASLAGHEPQTRSAGQLVGAFIIPLSGSLAGAGALAAQLGEAVANTAGAGVINLLSGLGLPADQARTLAEDIEGGRILVTVQAGEGRVGLARALLAGAGALPFALEMPPLKSDAPDGTAFSTHFPTNDHQVE